ncbi:hypothetical protein F4782DRAFT_543906 [Xylaria castorea]|nr:hypothetical protein F4782DRAFT_543906 [Xylaria castorea]
MDLKRHLQPCPIPLSVTGSAVGILSLGIQVTQSPFDYYAAFKSQHSDIAHTMRKLDDLLGTLEILRNLVVNRRFRIDEASLVNKIGGLIREGEERIQETTPRRVAYPFRKGALGKLNGDIEEITDRLELTLQLLQQGGIDRVEDDIEYVKALLNLVRSSHLSTELEGWLKAPDATINFNEARAKKHLHIRLWLLRGFAGCGKSVLCSTAIQYAFQHRRSDPRTGLAFFFFNLNKQSKQNASAILRALVPQLSMHQVSYDNLSRLHGNYFHASPPDEALLDCLHRPVKKFENIYILVDALDESPRNEPDIRAELEAMLGDTLEMVNAEVDQDIADFIAQHARENRRLRKWQRHYDQVQRALTD